MASAEAQAKGRSSPFSQKSSVDTLLTEGSTIRQSHAAHTSESYTIRFCTLLTNRDTSDWLRLNNDELKSLIREELLHRLDAVVAKMAQWRSTTSAALHPDHSTSTPEMIRAYDIDQLEEYVEKREMEEQEL
ncbi:hypothetical protein SpCBS45565_g04549 [Spizellomyces sp. 'palustris']|nr:hypothetical protein SpCBS45565_g04549 [Spizellomyces sp. 'palustris']